MEKRAAVAALEQVMVVAPDGCTTAELRAVLRLVARLEGVLEVSRAAVLADVFCPDGEHYGHGAAPAPPAAVGFWHLPAEYRSWLEELFRRPHAPPAA